MLPRVGKARMDGGEEGWEGEVKGEGGRAQGEISTGIKANIWNCV